MQIRILAGCQRLLMAAAIASLVFTPAAAQALKGKAGSNGTKAPSTTPTSTAVEEPQAKQPVLYPRSNYVWPFASGPNYGEVSASQWASPGVLHTAVGSFDLTRGLPNFPSELRGTMKLGTIGAQYFLLQVDPQLFTNGAFDELKSAIVAQGGAFVGEMPVSAFIVRMTAGAHQLAQGYAGVLALEPYHPALKLSPMIGRAPLADPAQAMSDVYSLELSLFQGEDPAVTIQALSKMGVKVTKNYPDSVFVEADRTALGRLAALESVRMIHEVMPVFLRGEETLTTMQTGRWNNGATPYTDAGVDGGGLNKAVDASGLSDDQLLMILDSGIQFDAGDLSNTRTDSGYDGTLPGNVIANHRKIKFYGNTSPFSGGGDLLGCDADTTSGSSHGHTVAATALGNATRVPGAYGSPWQAVDTNENPWDIDGVAPRARLIAYDFSSTPASGPCGDIGNGGGIVVGDLYSGGVTGSLGDGYNRGAKVVNFSYGTPFLNSYTSEAADADTFLFDKGDAMIFMAAGNNSRDTDLNGVPDLSTVGSPATAKNAVCMGGSRNADDQFNPNLPNTRYGSSSVGPVIGGRTAPILMAPASDAGAMGMGSEFNCRTNDNDQVNPVQCDVVEFNTGTSFASPAAAGAALLARDYFQQGFYPDGTNTNTGNASDVVPNISGALVKSLLIASADWMNTAGSNLPGANLTYRYRFNNQQGYGRIQLTNSLPLQTFPSSVSGLIVADHSATNIPSPINSTTLNTELGAAGTTSYTLKVCDNTQPLNVAMAWMDNSVNENIARDLNLELTAPSGRKYFGNFYTDDEDTDGVMEAGEGCDYTGQPWPPDSTGALDQGPWSLPVQGCANASHDNKNPTEAIHLSPDSLLNGVADDPNTGLNEALDNQLETGDWTVTVLAGTPFSGGTQKYALAISGGVCIGSSVRVQKSLPNNQLGGGAFVCNDSAVITVNEFHTAGDPTGGLTTAEIASRTIVEVIASDGVTVVDTETFVASEFEDVDGGSPGLRFDSDPILLTDGTAPDPGNNALDVRSGQTVRVTYQDEEPSGVVVPNIKRVSTGAVNCTASISAGGLEFGQFGKNAFTLVSGGCEKDARGYFTFGFPDRYMDQGELVGYLVAFQSAETGVTLQDVTVSLKAVATDADSPADCKPGGTCVDPNRSNNSPSPFLTVLDSPKVMGTLPAGAALTPSFTVQVAASITGVQQAEMILGVSAKTAGKGVESLAVQRETLNADAFSLFYSTDFPTGGTEAVGGFDFNNNEVLETVTNDPQSFIADYVFETQAYSDLTAGGFNSTAVLKSPWNFDTNNGGFISGIQNGSTPTITALTQWGEDKNFNNILDGFCSGNNAVACNDDNGQSEACTRCSNDTARLCTVSGDCVSPGTCPDLGNCLFTLGEDRLSNPPGNAGVLDQNWSTLGGCGWVSAGGVVPAPGGIWHTGSIKATSAGGQCVAAGALTSRCQSYDRIDTSGGDGSDNWWELLLTPILNKVNRCPVIGPGCPRADEPGNPTYQPAIDDAAWNMEVDLTDEVTTWTFAFDTDTNKLVGVDVFNAGDITNIVIFGPQGAVSGGNGPITGGFNMFAQISKCVDTDGNGTVDHCGTATGAACVSDAACTGNDLSPTRASSGTNRRSDNNCFFEGKLAGSIKSQEPYGYPLPADDDLANGYCNRSDSLNGFDKSVMCRNNTDCDNAGGTYTTCNFPNAGIDEFVQVNGPGRNYGVSVPNGPDMRFTTLEDFYGDTGEQFRAALGFYTVETTPSTPLATAGYGVGVDDFVIKWHETRLDEDLNTHCATGECADLEVNSTISFDANSFVNVSVTDKTTYGIDNVNDCNGNGSFADGGDDTDCNNNGTVDVTVLMTSVAEPTGEIAVLDRVSMCSTETKECTVNADCASNSCLPTDRYDTSFPYSSGYNSPGSLYIQKSGVDNPIITARYDDLDDGTGVKCKNFIDPGTQGQIFAATTVALSSGRVALKSFRMTDNGDNDGFADTNETVNLFVTFQNRSGVSVDDLIATLGTTDPDIDCISKPVVAIGTLANNGIVEAPAFIFKVKNTVNRTTLGEDLRGLFVLTLRSDQWDVISSTMTINVELDLNAVGAPPATNAFVEDFEAAPPSMGKFTWQDLDTGKNSLLLSDTMRCQYNDPDSVNSYSPGNPDCFLGFTGVTNNPDWHTHTSTHGGQGRSFTNNQSAHLGVHVTTSSPARDTTRLKQLDALRTIDPINLPLVNAAPELHFAHQISLVDERLIVNIQAGEATDRGVVQVQQADKNTGAPVGNWMNLQAYENMPEHVGTDDFFNCVFDPTDDGNDEDDLTVNNPGDVWGPSSTCYPERVYARQGMTDYRKDFVVTDIGGSNIAGEEVDGPGLQGNQGTAFPNRGTWVRPRFSLNELAGRRIRLRFVYTSIDLGTSQTWDAAVQRDDLIADDGWFIDDMHIDAALTATIDLAPDATANGGLPACASCTAVTPSMSATPATLAGPGQIVTLDASASTIDACPNGVPQFQFWIDANANGILGDGTAPNKDTVVREWSDEATFVDAPANTTNYGVKVRCSTNFGCDNSILADVVFFQVPVGCPSTGTLGKFTPVITLTEAAGAATISWTGPPVLADVVKGDLGILKAPGTAGNFTAAFLACLGNNVASPVVDAAAPGAQYYLLRLAPTPVPLFCNNFPSYSLEPDAAFAETAGRDAETNAAGGSCSLAP